MTRLECKTVVYKIVLFGLVSSIASFPNQQRNYEVAFNWKILDYKFPTLQARDWFLQTRQFIPENNVIAGIKLYGSKVFLTVPRWRIGVPFTLNVIDLEVPETSPKLEPYPNWEMQTIGDCSALQFVQSMEIDQYGRIWIIDTGRINLYAEAPENLCPPKLLIIDLETSEILRKHEFHPSVVSPTANYLNDIVVDCEDTTGRKCYAYITDPFGEQIVIYNIENNQSWSVHHRTMAPNLAFENITVLGQNYPSLVGVDGIALSPKDSGHDRIYYSPVSGFDTYSIPTSVLKEAPNGKLLSDRDVTTHFRSRYSQVDGLAMDSTGLLFYGHIQTNAVALINTTSPFAFNWQNILAQNDEDLQWADTFAFDEAGYLYYTVNRLHRFKERLLKFSEINFRVVKSFVGTKSYMYSSND